jgi:MFS family permease
LNASVFAASQAFGLILGPIFGTYSNHYYGFRFTSDIMSVITVLSVFAYLVIGNGFHAMMNPLKKTQTKKEYEEILDMTEGEIGETTALNSEEGANYGTSSGDITISED